MSQVIWSLEIQSSGFDAHQESHDSPNKSKYTIPFSCNKHNNISQVSTIKLRIARSVHGQSIIPARRHDQLTTLVHVVAGHLKIQWRKFRQGSLSSGFPRIAVRNVPCFPLNVRYLSKIYIRFVLCACVFCSVRVNRYKIICEFTRFAGALNIQQCAQLIYTRFFVVANFKNFNDLIPICQTYILRKCTTIGILIDSGAGLNSCNFNKSATSSKRKTGSETAIPVNSQCSIHDITRRQ